MFTQICILHSMTCNLEQGLHLTETTVCDYHVQKVSLLLCYLVYGRAQKKTSKPNKKIKKSNSTDCIFTPLIILLFKGKFLLLFNTQIFFSLFCQPFCSTHYRYQVFIFKYSLSFSYVLMTHHRMRETSRH